MNYNIDNFDRPEDKKKGMRGTIIFHSILLLLLIWPWFTRVYPLPEPGGLMASFGDVEIAGSNEKNESTEQEEVRETQNENPTENIEEVETIDDNDAPTIDPTPDPDPVPNNNNTEPNPQVDQNSLFNGNNNGNGNNSGDGQVGTPDGKDDLGNTGNGQGDQGDGLSSSRRVVKRCEDYQQGSTLWQEKGTAYVTVCVNSKGVVTSAKINRKRSTITSQKLIELVEGCAMNYKFNRIPGAPEVCDDINIVLNVR